jgi:osmotically-inducible protein OsmY
MKTRALALWAGIAMLSIACAQSDAGITTAVKAKFAADDVVKAYQIDVDTQEGVVTLSGSVESAEAERAAVRLASETDGVARVIDDLTVGGASLGSDLTDQVGDAASDVAAASSDATVTAAVKSKMILDSTVSSLQIDVDTEGGVVTLTGNVANAGVRDRAVAIARSTEGVKGVQDRLTINQ